MAKTKIDDLPSTDELGGAEQNATKGGGIFGDIGNWITGAAEDVGDAVTGTAKAAGDEIAQKSKKIERFIKQRPGP